MCSRGQRTAGIVCLSLGLIMLTTGIICCICMCKKANEAMRSGVSVNILSTKINMPYFVRHPMT